GWPHGYSAFTVGTPGEARSVSPSATRPSGALWGLSGAAQPPAWSDPSHPTPTGAGRGGGATWHPLLAVGQAAGPCLWAGDGHVSLLPTGHAPHHGRHHPGIGHDAYLAASPARLRPTAHCPGPCAPPDSWFRLGPRPVVWPRQRRARRSAVSRPCAPVPSLGHPPLQGEVF